MFSEQDRVKSYQSILVALDGVQGNFLPGADLHFDTVPQAVDDDKYWAFVGFIGGESAQRVSAKCQLQNLQDEYRTKRR